MTEASGSPAGWWSRPPSRQVSYLVGADPELLSIALDPLPVGAPAVVQFRPHPSRHLNDQVDVLLAELERVAVSMFPRWLPGAARLDGSGNLGVAAVRALAEQAAARSAIFGPFLIDLAERCLTITARRGSRLPPEVRASGLARVIAEAYGRDSTVLLIELPVSFTAGQERHLTNAAEWFVHHGGFTVWLAGGALHAADRVQSVQIVWPPSLMRLTAVMEHDTSSRLEKSKIAEAGPESFRLPVDSEDPGTRDPGAMFAPLSGRPRQDSAAELTLERALAPHEWAQGRHWNRTYEWQALARPYRLDLFWPGSRVVVEVDGPEHRGRLKYADDRHRDVTLQLLGYSVLRFTNEQVLWDVHAVVAKIEQLICRRRGTGILNTEMKQYAQP